MVLRSVIHPSSVFEYLLCARSTPGSGEMVETYIMAYNGSEPELAEEFSQCLMLFPSDFDVSF